MFQETSNKYEFKYLTSDIKSHGLKHVYLPPVPAHDKILFKKENKFVRPTPSEGLAKAMKQQQIYADPSSPLFNPDFKNPMSHQIQQWEDTEWERTTDGIWFWKNGKPIFLTPFHYWYLTAWLTYFGHPLFRTSDLEICYALQYCEEDPDCYGMLLNTIRRYGKSSIMGAWIVYRTTRNYNHYAGMQGEKTTKIAPFYQQMVLKPFRKLPYYFKPTFDTNSTQAKEIRLEKSRTRGSVSKKARIAELQNDVEELESVIDYRASGEGEYDGSILNSYVGEEPGKCHPKGTKVRLFNGELKNVEDIVIGDQLRGDDNIPRDVLNTGHGVGKIFKITPNSKGEPWYVNEHHIISCKVSGGTPFKGYKKGDVVNISLKTYFSLSPKKQAHLMCYRVGVEYSAKLHGIHPYLLGLWLGDGSQMAAQITNEDQVVVDWLNKHYSISTARSKGKAQSIYIRGELINWLKTYQLYKNKHIPNRYLIDSRENRLQLLAGLIDTDGHRCVKPDRPNQRYYEITQKRKDLAYQIRELCLSLGFYASIYSKIATMKRKDGTVYRSTVYRVSIYGHDLYEIPCLIERKKMPRNLSTYNAKDPMVYGFKVEYDRIDDYYGFNIDGNHLYLLEDYIVTHNTLEANINERWKIVKPCLRKGRSIRGKAFMGTTVEFMDVTNKGGKAYKKLFYESDFGERGKDGRTTSGLYAFFLPGDCAYEDFLDEFGDPLREDAKQSILLERETVKNNPKDLSDLIRKYPLYVKEIFYISTDRCVFNAQILQDRLSDLNMNTTPLADKVEFYWQNNVRFSKVLWRHNPQFGWAHVTELLEKADANRVVTKSVKSIIKYFPEGNEKHRAGVDPVDHGVVVEGKSGDEEMVTTRRSRPVMFVKRMYDTAIDGPLNQEILEERARIKYPYKTNKRILMMDARPYDPNVYYERALMICWFYGCSVQVEDQKPGLKNWFYLNNCEGFLQQKYVPISDTKKKNPYTEGTPASTLSINEYTDALAYDIEYFGHNECFKELLEDLLLFNPKKTTEYDYSVAAGWTELACKIRQRMEVKKLIDIKDLMPMFDESGMPVN